MKTIYKNDEPQEILQWKSKFKNKNGRVPTYSDLNEVENLLASCQGYHDREKNRYSNSAIEERLKLLTEMNGLGIRLRY